MTQAVDAVTHARDWMEITAYQHRVDTPEAHEVAELLLAEVERCTEIVGRVERGAENYKAELNAQTALVERLRGDLTQAHGKIRRLIDSRAQAFAELERVTCAQPKAVELSPDTGKEPK